MEDEEFYNVKDEAINLKTQHEGDGHVIESINPRDYATVDKVLEAQKKRAIKELGDLKKGMLNAYTNYRVEQNSRTRMESKGAAVIDGMALLPPGYKPPRKRKSEKKKPKPPTWGSRSTSAPTSARQHFQLSAVVNTDQQLRAGPALVDMSAVNIEDMTAKQDEIEQKYRESQLQMKVNLEIDKVNRVKNLLRYLVWVRYLKAYVPVHAQISRIYLWAVKRIQAFARKEVRQRRQARHFATVKFPVRFLLYCRIYRKRRATQVIRAFAQECAVAPYVYTIKKFTERVKKCVEYVRSFVKITLARRKMIKILWEKTEFHIRQKIDLAEKKEAKRLKAEMEQRMLQSANKAGKRQKESIHAQWLRQEAEVTQILGRSDLIQKQHRTTLRVIAGVLDENDGGEDRDSGSPAKKKTVEEFDRVDDDTITSIIAKHVRIKRAAHVNNVINEAKRRAAERGMVGVQDVKNMLLDMKFGDGSVLQRIEAHQLSGLHRVVNTTAIDFEDRPSFMPLTGKELGQSWYSIVEEAVHADIKSKTYDGTFS